MAELPPNIPTGAVPPPKKETGKVQPKKETVRINLPPKPSAAPTIKLPTLPPGGPTGVQAGSTGAAPAAHIQPPRATAAAPVSIAASQVRATTTQPSRPAPAPAIPTIKTIDKVLIYTLAVLSLAAVGIIVWGCLFSKNTIESFTS
jgi:hypothetical protein